MGENMDSIGQQLEVIRKEIRELEVAPRFTPKNCIDLALSNTELCRQVATLHRTIRCSAANLQHRFRGKLGRLAALAVLSPGDRLQVVWVHAGTRAVGELNAQVVKLQSFWDGPVVQLVEMAISPLGFLINTKLTVTVAYRPLPYPARRSVSTVFKYILNRRCAVSVSTDVELGESLSPVESKVGPRSNCGRPSTATPTCAKGSRRLFRPPYSIFLQRFGYSFHATSLLAGGRAAGRLHPSRAVFFTSDIFSGFAGEIKGVWQ